MEDRVAAARSLVRAVKSQPRTRVWTSRSWVRPFTTTPSRPNPTKSCYSMSSKPKRKTSMAQWPRGISLSSMMEIPCLVVQRSTTCRPRGRGRARSMWIKRWGRRGLRRRRVGIRWIWEWWAWIELKLPPGSQSGIAEAFQYPLIISKISLQLLIPTPLLNIVVIEREEIKISKISLINYS